ncbi:hypothetical protein MCHI_003640 [Candidatus Magnetoovum chiemensis]|nr:hypothetical protein MCHI_003640 [Candidatus Magnetoovum chiemensis]
MEGYDDIVTLKIFKKLALTFTKRLRHANKKIAELSYMAKSKKAEAQQS